MALPDFSAHVDIPTRSLGPFPSIPEWVLRAAGHGSSIMASQHSDGSIRWFVDGKEVNAPEGPKE